MRLQQMHQYLGELLEKGLDPNTIITIHDNTVNMDGDDSMDLYEVTGSELISGPYMEDPSPKMCGFYFRKGTVLLLTSCIDYQPLYNEHYHFHEVPVDEPEKTWPVGTDI